MSSEQFALPGTHCNCAMTTSANQPE